MMTPRTLRCCESRWIVVSTSAGPATAIPTLVDVLPVVVPIVGATGDEEDPLPLS
jgi:hypothetical protein